MKISLLSSSIILSLLLFSCQTTNNASLQEEMDNPPVQEEIEPVFQSVMVTRYQPSEVLVKLPDGRLDSRRIYQYDDNGNLVKAEIFTGQGDMIFTTEYIYEDQKKIRENLLDSKGLISYTTFKYIDGQLAEEFYFDPEDNFLSGSRFTYNNSGKRELWISLDKNQAPVLKTYYQYNDDLLEKLEFFSPFDDPEGYTLYTYSGNQWIEETSYNKEGNIEKRTSRVVENEQVMESTSFFGNRISRIQKNVFDEMGNITETHVSNRSGRVLHIEYYSYLEFNREEEVRIK